MSEPPRQEHLDLADPSGQAEADSVEVTHSRASQPGAAGGSLRSEPVQGGLFPDDSVPDELVGYRGPSACQIAGITYR